MNAPDDNWMEEPGEEGTLGNKAGKPWLDDRERFEESLVAYLLQRYDLADKRARFFLIDEYQKWRHDEQPKNALKLDAFCRFFPGFPVALACHYLHRSERERITVPKLLLSFEKTAMVRKFRENKERRGRRKLAVAFKWPHVTEPADAFVVHNSRVNVRVPGAHMLWTGEGGKNLMLETFESLLDTIDSKDPHRLWMDSALRSNFEEPLPAAQ